MTCLKENEASGIRQKPIVDALGRMSHNALEQIIENIGWFVVYSAMEEDVREGGKIFTVVQATTIEDN